MPAKRLPANRLIPWQTMAQAHQGSVERKQSLINKAADWFNMQISYRGSKVEASICEMGPSLTGW